ncbi:MAG: ATP-binding protein [Clostridia bacterium]|nr:ATP-binding protein [Clostridia bacterium]
MNKVILLCGKICSGKSTYAEKIIQKERAVLLSCDELMLMIFDPLLGDRHDIISERVQKYLYQKSLDVIAAGANVLLDWGYWQKHRRDAARAFYREKGIPCEFHYIDISDADWQKNIAERNRAIEEGRSDAYFIDEGLAAKFESLFEKPARDEMDVWYLNERK